MDDIKCRFIVTGHNPASWNMACDEAVLNHIADERSLPMLRLYGWAPKAVSIGYFQSLADELDLAACSKHGVEYVRRITGGGAVFHEHEITYSFLVPITAGIVTTGILESYEQISGGIIAGLEEMGVKAQFVPLNDLVITDPQTDQMKKISGNAQTRKKGVILQHGTILLKVDVDKMFELLKVPNEKLKGKLIEDIKQRVTGISDVLGRDVTFDEMVPLLRTGFEKALSNINLVDSELTEEEQTALKKLAEEKYSSDVWNKKR